MEGHLLKLNKIDSFFGTSDEWIKVFCVLHDSFLTIMEEHQSKKVLGKVHVETISLETMEKGTRD